MAEVSGEYEMLETVALASWLTNRLVPKALVFVVHGVVALGALLGVLLAGVTDALSATVLVMFPTAAVTLALISYTLIHRRLMRAALLRRSVPARTAFTVKASAEGLSFASSRASQSATWQTINEVGLVKDYWLFASGALVMPVARRLFDSEAAERAFMGEAFGYLTPAAQQASPQLKRFLGA